MEIKVKVIKEQPPKWIWDKCHEMFELDDNETIFTYGDAIYDPRQNGRPMSQSVIAHECRHMKQQTAIEGGPDAWWNLYFTDTAFRRTQELEAFQTQYAHYCTMDGDRNMRARYLTRIAQMASSPFYKLDLSYPDALKLIRNGTK